IPDAVFCGEAAWVEKNAALSIEHGAAVRSPTARLGVFPVHATQLERFASPPLSHRLERAAFVHGATSNHRAQSARCENAAAVVTQHSRYPLVTLVDFHGF